MAFVRSVKVTLAAAAYRPTDEKLILLGPLSLAAKDFCDGKKFPIITLRL